MANKSDAAGHKKQYIPHVGSKTTNTKGNGMAYKLTKQGTSMHFIESKIFFGISKRQSLLSKVSPQKDRQSWSKQVIQKNVNQYKETTFFLTYIPTTYLYLAANVFPKVIILYRLLCGILRFSRPIFHVHVPQVCRSLHGRLNQPTTFDFTNNTTPTMLRFSLLERVPVVIL